MAYMTICTKLCLTSLILHCHLLLEQQPAPTICRDLLSGRSHSYPAAERSSLGDAVTDDLPTEPRVECAGEAASIGVPFEP